MEVKQKISNPIISKTIKLVSPILPPKLDFIEEQIKLQNLEPVRWAIVDVNDNELTISASGYTLTSF